MSSRRNLAPTSSRARVAEQLLVNANQVVTCSGPSGPRRGAAMKALDVLTDAAVLVRGAEIAAVGPSRELQ
ncbi:MAG: hypothetical protein ACRENU_17305, partial [Gemmatimonadaceae bacterium]